MNYYAFHPGITADNVEDNVHPGLKSGFPAFHAISSIKPDFWVGNGNNVYYDEPGEFPAITREEMRKRWHWLFSMPEFNKMVSHIPGFWIMNDHDYRFNDCDTFPSDRSGNLLLPGNEAAKAVFYEQVPVFAGSGDQKVTYRTHRLNKDVQVWMLDDRLYRSPSNSQDVPGKSMLGVKQMSWLKSTLKESDAAFKLLITPTPFIGPDDNSKTDNHTNYGGFRTERDSFFLWLKNNGFRNNGFYIICGDLQWQYHSIDPTGFEEFSCGTLVDENALPGRTPGDTLSTDPVGTIVQPYVQKDPSGGFLLISSDRDEYNSPVLLFRFYDDQKKLLYATNKY
jgi:alkaline phosphatase/alkaline phosphatase D